ncbi:peptide/nickel transport system substrate-binding protein [Pasteurella langaaensis DSM 22999]|uniref:Peptide/nickel transport system substrate-binding protein n=1 Tax=Alitibacter langaaensis DSM 22999 TaxID=1122935 RepID=A0A2U0SNU4_9PAST|nr:peptide ABC transporter substrate-binding protein [Pasteurella langaaensis]PVX32997.1 peptide/nickel transport system substrate-binding protein [Pasteurella langaaensis DSM 22999]
MSKFSTQFSLNLPQSAVRFSLIFMSIFGLWGCDKLAHHQPKTTQQAEAVEEPTFTTNQLLRGVYSDLTLSINDVNNHNKASFLRDLLEGLVIYDREGHIIPAVAESWSTKDNKIWRFKIRKTAKWSSGNPVTAHDFVQSWQFLTQQPTALKQYLSFINLKNAAAVMKGEMPLDQLGVRALDDLTLEIELDKPTPSLPEMLVHVALLPMKYGKRAEFESNGAYRFVGLQGKFITLEKNPQYWDHENVHFDQVIYQKLGENQSVTDLDVVAEPIHKGEANQQFPQLCTYFYEFNLNDPKLRQSAVRTALVSMISPQSIVQNEHINGIPINEFLPRNMQLQENSNWQASLVEQLLQQSGISETKPLQLKVSYDQEGIHSSIANRLVRAWSQSDLIRAEPDPMSWTQLQEKRRKGEFQVIRSGWCADYNEPSAFFQLLYSQHPDNTAGFKNEEVDHLLAQSLKAQTQAERTAIYSKIQSIVKQERVFLPIFQYTQNSYISPTIKGFDNTNPTGVIYSKDLQRKTNSN